MGNLKYCKKHSVGYIPGYAECHQCEENNKLLRKIEDIESRFYGWSLSDQQDLDFTWLVNTLKERIRGSN